MEFAKTSTSTNEEPIGTESESKSEQSDNTTNIEWLRQRGVQIDIPSSRQSPSHSPNPQLDREVTIVKIPANVKLAYEEVIITVNDGIPGDQLITLLKPNFVGTGTENISNSALEKATESLLQSTPTATNGSTDPVSILDKTPEVQKSTLLNMFQNQGHVEAFNLTRPSESNKWKSVAIYLDEGGQLKGLPRNSRAESIAAQCGYEGVSLAGDVYVARRFQEGAIRHVSFGLDELSSTADWISSAHRDNYALGAANGQVSMEAPVTIDKGIHVSTDPLQSYEWNQDEDTVDVCFKLPAEYKDVSKKFLSVDISSNKLKVIRKAEADVASEDISLLDLALFAGIKVSDSTWSRSGDSIEFSLEKTTESEWAQLKAV